LVSTYLGAIIERQPKGPYALAGYSLGALVAFELAQRLTAKGERVAFLGCIDREPGAGGRSVDWIYVVTWLAWLLELLDLPHARQLESDLRLRSHTLDPADYVLERVSQRRLAELNLDASKFLDWARVAHAVENLILQHNTMGRAAQMSVFY